MIRAALFTALLTLTACGVDGEPIRPGSAADTAQTAQ